MARRSHQRGFSLGYKFEKPDFKEFWHGFAFALMCSQTGLLLRKVILGHYNKGNSIFIIMYTYIYIYTHIFLN